MGSVDFSHVRVLLAAIAVAAGALLLMVTVDASQERERRAHAINPRPAALAAPNAELVAAREARAEAPAVSSDTPAAASTRGAQRDQLSVDAPANRAGTSDRPDGELTMTPTRDLPVRANPGGGRVLGTLPVLSNLGTPMRAWVLSRTADGRYGRVTVPWSGTTTTGWVSLAGAELARTNVVVRASLSKREVVVLRGGAPVVRLRAAVGAPGSPTPVGLTYVTDRVPVPRSQPYYGSYAFGLAMTQPRLPAGWKGGNQMAIHGTDSPGTIGAAVSAGCLRVSETGLDQLKPLLRLGTPVVIEA